MYRGSNDELLCISSRNVSLQRTESWQGKTRLTFDLISVNIFPSELCQAYVGKYSCYGNYKQFIVAVKITNLKVYEFLRNLGRR